MDVSILAICYKISLAKCLVLIFKQKYINIKDLKTFLIFATYVSYLISIIDGAFTVE